METRVVPKKKVSVRDKWLYCLSCVAMLSVGHNYLQSTPEYRLASCVEQETNVWLDISLDHGTVLARSNLSSLSCTRYTEINIDFNETQPWATASTGTSCPPFIKKEFLRRYSPDRTGYSEMSRSRIQSIVNQMAKCYYSLKPES